MVGFRVLDILGMYPQNQTIRNLGGGLKYFLFSPLLGEGFQFD